MVAAKHFLIGVLLTIVPAGVHGLRNITIDDTDSIIKYTGTWDPDTNHYSDLDHGGAHTISEDSKASATFTFTGVAIYYMSPLWPYAVNTQLALDGGLPVTVDLTDHSVASTNGGEETVESAVVYAFTGLANTQHTLVATRAPGGQYIIMDGLIYTIVDTSLSQTQTSSQTSTSTSPSSTDNSTAVMNSADHSPSDKTAIGVGVGVGLLAFSLACVAVYLFLRSRRLRRAAEVNEHPTDAPIIVSPYYGPPPGGAAIESWAPYNDASSGQRTSDLDAGSFRQSKDSSAGTVMTSMPALASVLAASPGPGDGEFDPRTLYATPASQPEARLASPPPPAYSVAHGAGKAYGAQAPASV